MIPVHHAGCAEYGRKPRASGDDPVHELHLEIEEIVNPARAGMIQRRDA